MKVRCNWCEFVTEEEELIIEQDTERCPECDRGDCLMDTGVL